jgi:hypothetical protein
MLNPNVNNFYKLKTSVTLAGSGGLEALDLFKINGAVKIKKLEGIVKSATTLTNMTDCHFNINDATIDVPITKSTTLTMSTAIVGSVVFLDSEETDIAGFLSGATAGLLSSAGYSWNYSIEVIQKTGVETNIQFVYTTTDTPIAATMDFYVEYEPIANGYLEIA